MKKYICILAALLLVFSLTSVSNAIFLSEKITENMIEEAIALGKSGDLYEYKKDNSYIIMDIGDTNSDGEGYYYNIYTPYMLLSTFSSKKAKKYMEPSRKEIEDLLNSNLILVDYMIFNKNNTYDPDDIHMVIKEVDENNIIQPLKVDVGELDYSTNYGYSITCTAYFNTKSFTTNNGELDMEVLFIFISNLGEIRTSIQLGDII